MTGHHSLGVRLRHIALHVVLMSVGVLFMLPFVWSISTSLKPISSSPPRINKRLTTLVSSRTFPGHG